jgi:hypothetical protein
MRLPLLDLVRLRYFEIGQQHPPSLALLIGRNLEFGQFVPPQGTADQDR